MYAVQSRAKLKSHFVSTVCLKMISYALSSTSNKVFTVIDTITLKSVCKPQVDKATKEIITTTYIWLLDAISMLNPIYSITM